MGHVDHLDPERARLLDPAGLEVLDGRALQLVLLELGADHPDRQAAAEDHRGHADLAQEEGQRADVVLVAVGEDDRVDVVDPVAKVGEVGENQVDAEHLSGREHQTGVDHDDAPVELDHRHVLADFAEPAERQDPELAAHATMVRSRLLERGAHHRSLALITGDHRQAHPLRAETKHFQGRLERHGVGRHRECFIDWLQCGI